MKSYLLNFLIVLSLSFGGCGINGLFGSRIPSGNEGSVEQQETNKSKASGTIKGKIKLPDSPVLDQSGKVLPNQNVKIDGIEASFPQGTTGEINLDGDGDVSTYTINSILTKWKLSSPTTGLLIFGGVLVVAGIALFYFGAFGFGSVCGLSGFALIACSILLEKYPLVIIGILVIAVLVGIYLVYNYVKSKGLEQSKTDAMTVLSKIAAEIEKLPSEAQVLIKTNLQKDDDSATIKTVVSEAKSM
jgi:uncharacterized protein (UPF0333 family)